MITLSYPQETFVLTSNPKKVEMIPMRISIPNFSGKTINNFNIYSIDQHFNCAEIKGVIETIVLFVKFHLHLFK